MPTTTDAELLAAFATRQEEAAFGELMRRHGALVYRACHRLMEGPFLAGFPVAQNKDSVCVKGSSRHP